MRSLRSVAALAAVGGAVLALTAACGGGDDSSGTTEAAPPATSAAAPATGAGEASGGGMLEGTVGPGFTITLTQDGQPATSIPAGTYEIVVDDKASQHDFHLTGPGVDESTDVGGTGKTTWSVTLEPGEYTFVCDPHASSMNGSFTVS
jgi:plastocyanin